MRILVVDRLEENVELIRSILKDYDTDGKTVVSYDGNYDLAIIDYKEIDNIDFDRVPTIIISANMDALIEINSLESGAVDFLNKPLHPGVFYVRIKKALKRNIKNEYT